MGYYVNPGNCSKEAFLISHGIEVPSKTLDWDAVPNGCLPVVLVKNSFFTAAGIAYSPDELAAFTDPADRRPRTIFIVGVEDLLEVGGDDFRLWAERNGHAPKTN